jgi:hypothetical protein
VDNNGTLTPFRGDSAIGRPVRSKGSGSGHVDYSLARKATLRALAAGKLSKMEVCDAHPDLLRAARYAGERIADPCPICEWGAMVLVRYAFSDGMSKRENGMVWRSDDVSALLKFREARVYTVEVCTGCSWNHLRSQLMLEGTPPGPGARSGPRPGAERRGRKASTT